MSTDISGISGISGFDTGTQSLWTRAGFGDMIIIAV